MKFKVSQKKKNGIFEPFFKCLLLHEKWSKKAQLGLKISRNIYVLFSFIATLYGCANFRMALLQIFYALQILTNFSHSSKYGTNAGLR
jgi:hypothetical protein